MSSIVADDRASLLTPSEIEYTFVGPASTPGAPATSTSGSAEPPQATTITPGGRFACTGPRRWATPAGR